MDDEQEKRLKEMGGYTTTVAEFLGLSKEDEEIIEFRLRCTSQALGALHFRVGDLSTLQDGWLDGEGKAPTDLALGLCLRVVGQLLIKRPGLVKPSIFPTPEGGVQAEWSTPGFAMDVEFNPDGQTVRVVVSSEEEEHIGRFDTSLAAKFESWLDRLVMTDTNEERTPPRAESGAMQFGDDWPGLFLRGDSAVPFGMALQAALNAGRFDTFNGAMLKGLCESLLSADVTVAKPQRMKTFEECTAEHSGKE